MHMAHTVTNQSYYFYVTVLTYFAKYCIYSTDMYSNKSDTCITNSCMIMWPGVLPNAQLYIIIK